MSNPIKTANLFLIIPLKRSDSYPLCDNYSHNGSYTDLPLTLKYEMAYILAACCGYIVD